MSGEYQALAERIAGFESAWLEWLSARLAGAGWPGLSVGFGSRDDASGLWIEPVQVAPGKVPDVGLDYGLMGSWGSDGSGAIGPVPPEWAAFGRAARRRLEALAVSVQPEHDASQGPPSPMPVLLSSMPSALRSWYTGRPDTSGQTTADGWPADTWTTDTDAGPAGRLPYLAWNPGFDLTLRYELGLGAADRARSAQVMAVVATAMQVARGLSTELPEIELPDSLTALAAALDDVPAEGDDDAPAQLLADALGLGGLSVTFTVTPAPGTEGGPRIAVSTRLKVLRGVTLQPASRLAWRTAPPSRSRPRSEASDRG